MLLLVGNGRSIPLSSTLSKEARLNACGVSSHSEGDRIDPPVEVESETLLTLLFGVDPGFDPGVVDPDAEYLLIERFASGASGATGVGISSAL